MSKKFLGELECGDTFYILTYLKGDIVDVRQRTVKSTLDFIFDEGYLEVEYIESDLKYYDREYKRDYDNKCLTFHVGGDDLHKIVMERDDLLIFSEKEAINSHIDEYNNSLLKRITAATAFKIPL